MAQVSRDAARALRPLGFKRQGLHLHRQVGSLFHAFAFQASQWGSRDAGEFTVNLVVASPVLFTLWCGRPFPKNPATALFPVQKRIGRLMPDGKDHWWRVDAATDVPALSTQVVGALEAYGLPFFAGFENDLALLEILRRGECPGATAPQAAVIHGLLASNLGLKDEAREALRRACLLSEIPSFTSHVHQLATRVDLSPL